MSNGNQEIEKMDCIIVGYNDVPLPQYVDLLSNYGVDSMAYRDLRLSFVDIQRRPASYVDLMNLCTQLAERGKNGNSNKFKSGEIPNLAAGYLANFLRRQGLNADYINLFQDEKSELAARLRQDPLCIAITTTFYLLNFAVTEIVKFIRSHNSSVKIIVGGPLVANHLRNFSAGDLQGALQDMGADFYVADSQGESTLAALVKTLKSAQDPANIPNLIYFDGGQLMKTMVVPESNSMDEVDIDWQEVGRGKVLGRTIQIRTARSCAFKCSFCNYPTRAGNLSLASLQTIQRELESIRRVGNVNNVVFVDDTFNVPLPRFKDLCRMIIEKDFKFNWYSYFRCSNSDEEAIDLMARSGCRGVFLGIESGSPKILKNMNKAASIERYAEGIRLLRQYGIVTFGSFIIGFPGETDGTVQETLGFIRENRPDFYRSQLWYCEAGTPIDRDREKYGIRGQGFMWQHETMTAPQAMDYIEEMFRVIEESIWLPQWSFDFWFIPYAMGKGLSMQEFKDFVLAANKLVKLDIAPHASPERERTKKAHFRKMVDLAGKWQIAE